MNKINVIKTDFSIDERGTFISRVVNSCFSGTDFHIEMLEPVFQITLMQMMTDKLPITTKVKVDNNEVEIIDYNATYKMIQDEDIMSQIRNAFKSGVFSDRCEFIDDLHSDVIESLEYKKAQMIAMTSPLSSLLESVKNAVDNFDPSKYSDIIKLAQNANKFNVTKDDFIDSIVKNLPKNDSKNEQKDVK
jgi:hypothetical protein